MTSEEVLNTAFIMIPDDEGWFIQGINIDYFASGETQAEALESFTSGLRTLVKSHNERFGHLDHLRPPPYDILIDLLNGED